eukprot:TRINITY_DN2732_c0_g1_i2.p1 TRINITY_DN2732_c0_g1~~TRINITY_DN2732_c0_g1_i2.p1  ORF type:complete len:1526 (+),score=336.21 TRINITY_DN2732_c0_g1_i2:307-4884(+)
MAKEEQFQPYQSSGVGAGGKIRNANRTRARNATPYDRPPTGRHAPAAIRLGVDSRAKNSTWLSKLVDPASRLIVSGASRLLSSVFRKSLTGPLTSVEDSEASKDHGAAENNVAENSKVQTEEAHQEEIQRSKPSGVHAEERDDVPAHQNSSSNISELENILKGKTFSREEFSRWMDLLQSRVVDEPVPQEERNDSMNAPKEGSKVKISDPQRLHEEWESKRKGYGNGLDDGAPPINGESSMNASKLPVEGGSPADIAKAYMDGCSYRALSSSAIQSRPLWNECTPEKSNTNSVIPRQGNLIMRSNHLEETNRRPQYVTPHSGFRSMNRTPYARILRKSGSDFSLSNTSCSRWTPIKTPITGGREMLKRRSCVFEEDASSVGPIRRTRQRLIAPPKSFDRADLVSDYSVNLSTPLPPRVSGQLDSGNKLLVGYEKPLQVQNNIPPNDQLRGAFVPQKSTETARKILEQLERMVPSPKEKSPEALLATARDKSPGQLTDSMLNGPARRSTESLGVLSFEKRCMSSDQGNGQSGTGKLINKNKAKGKMPLDGSDKALSNAPSSLLLGADSKGPEVSTKNVCDAGTSVVAVEKTTVTENQKGFQMRAPELAQDSDEEDHVTFTVSNKDSKSSPVVEPSGQSSFKGTLGFSFPVTASSSMAEPPPTPTFISSPLPSKPAAVTPTSSFGSSCCNGSVYAFSASTTADIGPSKPPIDLKSGSKPELLFSNATTRAREFDSNPSLQVNSVAVASASPLNSSVSAQSADAVPVSLSTSKSSSVIFSVEKNSFPTSNTLPQSNAVNASESEEPASIKQSKEDAPSIESAIVSIPHETQTVSSTSVPKKYGSGSTNLQSPFSSQTMSAASSSSFAITTSSSPTNIFGFSSTSTQGLVSVPAIGTSATFSVGMNSIRQATSHSPSFGLSAPKISSTTTEPASSGSVSNSNAAFSLTSETSSVSGNTLPSSPSFCFGSGSSSGSSSMSSPSTSMFTSSGSSLFSVGSLSSGSSTATTFAGSSALSACSSVSIFGGSPSSHEASNSNVMLGSGTVVTSSSGFLFGTSSNVSPSQQPKLTFGTNFGSSSGSSSSQVTTTTSGPIFGACSVTSSLASGFGATTTTPSSQSMLSVTFGSSTSSMANPQSTTPTSGFAFGNSNNAMTSSQSSASTFAPIFGSSSAASQSPTPTFAPAFGSSSASSQSTATPFAPLFGNSSASSHVTSVTFGSGLGASGAVSSSQPTISTFGSASASSNATSSSQAMPFVFGSAMSSSQTSSSFAAGCGASTVSSSQASPSFAAAGFGASTMSSSQTAPQFGSAMSSSQTSPSFGLPFGASSSMSPLQTSAPIGSSFGFTASSPIFSFGNSSANSGNFTFGASGSSSTGNAFSFGAANPSLPFSSSMPNSSMAPQFGLSNSTATFGATLSPPAQAEQMEDRMAEDTQVSVPPAPVFGAQTGISPSPSPFLAASQPAAPTGQASPFQFGSQQSPATAIPFAGGSQNAFQSPAGAEFSSGFSVGTAGDKSTRRIIKPKRTDRSRRK